MWIYDFALCCQFEKCRKYTFLGGSAQIYMILHRRGYRNLLQYYMGGPSRSITILQWGGGSLGTPNLYYVINGRPLMCQCFQMIGSTMALIGTNYFFCQTLVLTQPSLINVDFGYDHDGVLGNFGPK